ncbi:carbohydrate ABC transporter permease [Cohnella sp.]|uniref:carbohydrate ABC transporter permease n=1 Tax=Cohnella sp. TaxID=1883426 RepID=UPI0035617AEB
MPTNKLTRRMYPQYLLVPALLLYSVLFLFPNVASFYYAFTNWNAISSTVKFIGFDNFKEIFGSASGNVDVFQNTAVFAVYTTVLKIVLGLILALLLKEGIRTRNVLRAVFFLPITISIVLVGIMFSEIFSPDGILNGILRIVGLDSWTHSWIAEPGIAIWSVATVEVWRASGFAMAIFLAALQMVPKEMYEAAEIDGAAGRHKLLYVTLPYLYQAIVLNTLFGMISGLKVFDLVYVLTNGGPIRSTEVLNVTVLNEFSKGAYGYSTAMGLILFLFVTLAYFGVNALFKKFEVDVS